MQTNLFVNNVAHILEKYQLPCPYEIMQNPPSKNIWKSIVKEAVNNYWYEKYCAEKVTNTTMRHLEIQQEPIGTPHNIWNIYKK